MVKIMFVISIYVRIGLYKIAGLEAACLDWYNHVHGDD